MVSVAGLGKIRVELKDTYTTFSDRPFLLALIVLSTVLTNFVVSVYINLYFFASPLVVGGLTPNTLYIGISTSVFTFGVIVFSAFSGVVFHKLSIKNLIILAIATCTVFSVLTGYATNIPELIAFRFLVGLGNGIIQGTVTAVLGGINPARRGFLLSLKGITYSSGVLVGPNIESVFAPLYSPAFLYSGLVGVASLILLLFFLPDIHMVMGESRQSHWRKLFNRNTSLIFLSIFLFGTGFFGFISYYSHFLLYYLGFGSSQSALIVSFLGIGGLVMTVPFATASDRWGRKPILVSIFALLSASSFSIFYFHNAYLTLIFLSFVFGGAYNGLINLVAAAAQDWAHDDAIGTASGATFSFYYSGGVVGGALFGILRASIGFPDTGFLGVTLFMVLAFICTLMLKGGRDVQTKTVMPATE